MLDEAGRPSFPITRSGSGEILLCGAWATASRVPSTPNMPPSTVPNRYLTIGMSLARGWK